MVLADLNGPRSLQPRRARSRRVLPACSAPLAALFLAGFFFSSPAVYAQGQETSAQQNQSVADAARQERARKEEQQKSAKHVYTEEDLKRKQILTPEDQAKVEARKNECATKNNCGPTPEQNAPAALDANGKSAQPSLGEIARQLRQQKELEALKPKQSEPFHLPMDNPVLASPIVPERSAVRPPVPPVLRPEPRSSKNRSGVFRRDPFAPAPTRPRFSLRGESPLRPTIPSHSRSDFSAAPKISPRIVAPKNFVTPAQPSQPALDSSAAQPKSHSFAVQPVHPSAPARSHRAASPAVPSRIFSAPTPVAPLSVRPVNPAAPAESVNPTQPVPAPRQPVASTAAKTIRVQAGDSLWKLARRNLGHGALWSAILTANPAITDPSRLHVGDDLALPAQPPVSSASRATASTHDMATIMVHHGDTLWSLAQANLGHAANWSCLAAANPSITNPNRIYAGQLLVLPSGCGSSRMSNGPATSK